MKFLYLFINVGSLLVPFLFSFHPKIKFYKEWKYFWPANFIAAFVFLIWDAVFTQRKVWGFNTGYTSGVYFFNLPIEEVLFFICIPFACVFTYHCLGLFFDLQQNEKHENIVCIALIVLLLGIGLIQFQHIYTSFTFISTALLLATMKFVFKIKWFGNFICVYPVLLIPFFVVNGILTGSGLQEPVVWYNNAENLGIRLFTIPIEDVVYGFELIMLNVFFYEYFRSKNHETVNSLF